MISIQEHVELKPFNTFGISARARFFCTIRTPEEAVELFRSDFFRSHPFLILGGGSNVLLTKDFSGLVVKNEIKGISIFERTPTRVLIRAGAGENWHELVMHCVSNDFGGIENLSLIPGTAGAAPMQNIGAYGVEIKDVIHNVEAIDLATGATKTFSKDECQFGYRESIFKQALKNKYFISSITLSLTTVDHRFNTNYGAIAEVIAARHSSKLSVKNISDAVISIRQSKLPDPSSIGNAGSFFKNPSIDVQQFQKLKSEHSNIPSFPGENQLIKVPAAWLIEQCGWKGKTIGNIGVHKHQALVLVNYGGGEGSKIWELAKQIQQSVREKFNITLQPEVNVI